MTNETVSVSEDKMFAPEQENAVDSAAIDDATSAPATDIRITIGSYFFRVIAGKERRSAERLEAQAEEHPVLTKNNMPMLLLLWVVIMCTLYYMVEVGIYLLTGVSFN